MHHQWIDNWGRDQWRFYDIASFVILITERF